MNPREDQAGLSDTILLRRYVEEGCEAAFGEFVNRHVALVYSSALRQLSGDAHRAQDICQAVFIAAAREAGSLRRHPALIGWLYTTTHHLVQRQLRGDQRRARREREAQTMRELDQPAGPDWPTLRPILDEAMQDLREPDRLAVLLRFFEGRNLRSVGEALGVSEDAARMRVERALDRLRAVLSQRGIHTTAAALAPALGAAAAEVAPLGLAGKITASALATAGLAAVGSGSAGALATLPTSVALMKTPLITTSLAVALVAVPLVIQNAQLSASRAELGRMEASARQLDELRSSRDARARLGGVAAELDQLRAESAELAQLRAERARLTAALNDPLQAQLQQVEASRQAARATLQDVTTRVTFARDRERVIQTMKQLALCARIHASDHQDQLPRSFEEFAGQIKDMRIEDQAFSLDQLEQFEFYPQPRPIQETEPTLFLFRERQPRPRPDGGWERAYAMVDGSVQTLASSTPDFSETERKAQGIASPVK
jgi:RNA polymerase sigma factor (sigma-70 family)